MNRGMSSGLIFFTAVSLVYWGCSQENPSLTAKNHQPNCPFSEQTRQEKEVQPPQNQKKEEGPWAEIVVTPTKVGTAPLRVSFQAKSMGLEEPLTYSWFFGDGNESALKEPPARTYGVGRFNVLLTIIDKNGKKAKASVTIESKWCGC